MLAPSEKKAGLLLKAKGQQEQKGPSLDQFTTAVSPDSYKIFNLCGAKPYINECNAKTCHSLSNLRWRLQVHHPTLCCAGRCLCYDRGMGEWQDKKPFMVLSLLCKYMLQRLTDFPVKST